MKKRIAIWMHGGIGTGHFSQGVPALEKILNGLSESFDLVIYSLSPINREYHSELLVVKTAPKYLTRNWIRWTFLVCYFVSDHIRRRFNVIFSFWGYPSGLIAVVIAKLLNRPSIVYLLGSDAAGVGPVNYGILHHPRLRRRAFWGYKRATRLLGISEYQNNELEAFGLNRDLWVIPWGADLSLFPYKTRLKTTPLKILHVGHHTHVKDQLSLLKAFAIIRRSYSAQLKMVGTDLMQGALRKYCIESGIGEDVEFVDMQPYDQMPAFYAWADLMLHTSLSEGQCMALTEAAATGVLLAGTRVGLLHDLGEESAITVEVGDHEGLAEKVLAILSDRGAWDHKVGSARLWAEQHDMRWTIDQLTRLLKEDLV